MYIFATLKNKNINK